MGRRAASPGILPPDVLPPVVDGKKRRMSCRRTREGVGATPVEPGRRTGGEMVRARDGRCLEIGVGGARDGGAPPPWRSRHRRGSTDGVG
jgi:hypothetical protein